MRSSIYVLAILLCLTASASRADTEFYKQFQSDYQLVDLDLLNHVGEAADIEDFVYQKDVATFTFEKGTIHLLRYIQGRPTTAVFIGKGRAEIDIPAHTERQCTWSVTGDSVISERFEICLIRMADDLDLKLKERFTFSEKQLKWKEFTQLKQAQGETFFKPMIQHTYDNYFQLLRSVNERTSDGFFWIDFNRYVFMFDPHRPEQVNIGYEFQFTDEVATEAACFQRKESGLHSDEDLSRVNYPTTALHKHGTFEMGGLDGAKIVSGRGDMRLLINDDSTRMVSTWLHFNLKVDSVYLDGRPAEFVRRKDFEHYGIILPEVRFKGDTIDVSFWYSGFHFDYSLPYVLDPTPCRHTFDFTIPRGYNYIMPGMGPIRETADGKWALDVDPQYEYSRFYFQGYASGYDTSTVISDNGIPVKFLNARHITKKEPCFVPDGVYSTSVLNSLTFMSGRMGNPIGTFELWVYPDNYWSMPGMVEIPKLFCYNQGVLPDLGGFDIVAGHSMAKQWFGAMCRPSSYRDMWFKDAAPQYLSVSYIMGEHDPSTYFSNLVIRRDSIFTLIETNRDRPLAINGRGSDVISSNRGAWLFHMLRFLMYDLETNSDAAFWRFYREFAIMANQTQFSNRDLVQLAEKHYGDSLGWFFKHWLYGFGYPEYNVEYKVARQDEDYFIKGKVTTKGDGVRPDFKFPVIMKVNWGDGKYLRSREWIEGYEDTFELGPFSSEPSELIFNDLISVMSSDKVKKN